jgi:WD40 repeat protein
VLGVALAPDQKTLISAGADQQQWVQTVSALRTSVVGEGKLALFTLAANGAVFATEGPDSTVKLWDANSGNQVREFKGLKEGVKGVAIRADNQQLVAAGGDSQLLLWNLNDAAVQLKYTLASPGGLMSYSADGKKLLVACADKVLRTFNPQVTPPQQGVPPAPLAAVQELKGTAADIHGLAVLADGKQALSVSGDGQLRRWSVASADPVFNLAGHQSFVYAVAFHPSGKMVASASNDKTVKFWDAVAGREIRTLTPQQGPIYSLDFNPQGTLLATGCIDRSVRVFNPENGLELRQLVGAEGAVYSVHFHPNGQTLAVGGLDKKVRLFDAQSGGAGAVFSGHKDDIYRVQFNPTGTRLLSVGYSGEVLIWDLGNPAQPVFRTKLPVVLYNGVWSPDGQRVLLASATGRAYLLELPGNAR